MIYIILFAIVIFMVCWIKRLITKRAQQLKSWLILYQKKVIIAGIIVGLIFFTEITILLVICIGIYFLYSKYMLNSRLKLWSNTDVESLEYEVVDDELAKISTSLFNSDNNIADYKFDVSNFPYGRINAFLNYFGRNLMDEEIYYFSPLPSKNEDEIREYGMAVTGSGIFLANQINKKKSKLKEVLFSGLKSVRYSESAKKIETENIVCYGTGLKRTVISQEETTIPLFQLANVLEKIQKSDIPHVLFENKIISDEDREDMMKEGEEKVWRDIDLESMNKNMSNIGAIDGSSERNKIYTELGNNMNMRQGHGYGAEYANKTVDRILGKKVVGTQEKVNGHHMKDGADRIVNGQKIQVKYCKTARDTYRAGFRDSNHDYSGQKIEVPRDQYDQIKKMLQDDIDQGKIEGVESGTSADKLLKKGPFTYAQAENVTVSGTVESLGVDLASGVVTAVPGATISAVMVFAMSLWQGADLKEASKTCFKTAGKVIGKSAAIYTITMQVSRSQISFLGLGKRNNPFFNLSNRAAKNISESSLAKTAVGKKMNLKGLNGQKVTSGVITVAIVFGPDVCRACTGKISVKQLAKNATVGAAGMVGAGIGSAVAGPVGGVIGGAVVSAVTKKVADNFVEDDAVRMFRVLKEEFLDVVMSSYLSDEEFNMVASNTIFSKKVAKELRNMYQVSKNGEGEHREYAREMITEEVIEVMKKRNCITNEMWNHGQELLVAGAE